MLETGRRILTWRGMLTLTLLYINRGVDASVITYAMAMALNSICRYFTAWVLWVILHICRKIFFCEFQCDTHHNLYTFRLCFTYNLQDVTQELMDLEEQNRKLMAQVLELEQQKEEENKSATANCSILVGTSSTVQCHVGLLNPTLKRFSKLLSMVSISAICQRSPKQKRRAQPEVIGTRFSYINWLVTLVASFTESRSD